jgi:ribosomal protein S12 methylthiotransferase
VKVSLVTLGCDKNTVDSERYLARLVAQGATATDEVHLADVILVNTCGFIDAAKRESLDALLEAGRYKSEGNCRAVVALGCMVERHRDELGEALPEVDLFLGTSDVDRLIPALIERGLLDEAPPLHPGERMLVGELAHARYLKVSEGCDHGCAFCAIPLMRGRHRSFALGELVREAQLLELQGTRELNLVAQDLAHYGRDRRDGTGLPELLEALVSETAIPWIRLMYLYSAGITPRLLEVVAREPRILRYLDMPIQHGSDTVLERMRRPERQRTIRERVTRYRSVVPELAIRTTCIVGFPGETEDDVVRLLEFLEEMQFDRVGVFAYSPQEGTRAFGYPDDVPDDVKLERVERVSELQRAVTAERLERRVGNSVQVLVDRVAPGEPAEARTPWQADDIDGVTYIEGGDDLRPGDFVQATLTTLVDDYSYGAIATGEIERIAAPVRHARRLPMMIETVGSFGR